MSAGSAESLGATLIEAWRQTLAEGRDVFETGGHRYPTGRTRTQGLKTVGFSFGEFHLEGIEQNPNKSSRWAKLAQEGKRIMQFSFAGRYVANVCEGKLTRYPMWKGKGLPD